MLIAACRGETKQIDQRPSGHVIVSNEDAGTIAVIDARSHAVTATIRAGKRPRGVRLSPDGRLAYVALSGSPKSPPGVDESTLPPPDRAADGIGVIDLVRREVLHTLPSGQDPEAFDLVGDATLVVSNEETAEASIIDLVTRRVRARVPAGGEPEGVTTAPDGTVWVTSEEDNHVTVIDPARGVVLATVPTGIRPRTVAFTADGTLALVPGELDASLSVIDVRARRPITRIAIPSHRGVTPLPMGVAISRDGKQAYVTTGRGGTVAIVDIAARKVVNVIGDVGKRPWGIAVANDGLVYTANGPSHDVAVIDPAAGRVVRHIPVVGSPWGVAVAP